MGTEEQRNNNLAIGGPGLFPPPRTRRSSNFVCARSAADSLHSQLSLPETARDWSDRQERTVRDTGRLYLISPH